MSVKIRLARRGRKKKALFDVVIADSRAPRDGKFIEKVGTYNPQTIPATIELKGDSILEWLMNGAQPTDTVRAMLSYHGIMHRMHLQVGVRKGAITQETADKRQADFMKKKEEALNNRVTDLTKTKEDDRKARLAAEAKVKEKRAEAIRAKKEAAVQAITAAPTASEEETPVTEE
ncbi:MAG: 30S ribosomal protein S16 [Cytophagales bacterium]|nr:MAG: 30S ribosomal protein S16 [Cytophagales bacterium]TAF61232.1 MAG: 30S ribosomal protein S16 [Cytophagales bacterium]